MFPSSPPLASRPSGSTASDETAVPGRTTSKGEDQGYTSSIEAARPLGREPGGVTLNVTPKLWLRNVSVFNCLNLIWIQLKLHVHSTILVNIGCTAKSSSADRNSAAAKSGTLAARGAGRTAGATAGWTAVGIGETPGTIAGDATAAALSAAYGSALLERHDFSSSRHPAPALCLSMIFSENREPLFGIMLSRARTTASRCRGRRRSQRCRSPSSRTVPTRPPGRRRAGRARAG